RLATDGRLRILDGQRRQRGAKVGIISRADGGEAVGGIAGRPGGFAKGGAEAHVENRALIILAPPSQTPTAVPSAVRKKLSSTRATRLRHQPRHVFRSWRKRPKSATVGLRNQSSTAALTVPEPSAGCSGVIGEAAKAAA